LPKFLGNRIACNGAGGVPPVTLAEFTFDGWGGQDYYDISLVDGYNLPMQIVPIAGTYRKTGNGKYDCNTAGCYADLNARCPGELAVKPNGWAVACKSACEAFNTDQYCCRGAYNTPQTCKSSNWPTNYLPFSRLRVPMLTVTRTTTLRVLSPVTETLPPATILFIVLRSLFYLFDSIIFEAFTVPQVRF